VCGGAGNGIIIFKYDGDKILINGLATTFDGVRYLIGRLNSYLITEYVEQAEYSSQIFPRTTNTIRILTMWDSETNKPFIATAVHRFGTDTSFPVDNWTQGGLSVRVDLETGKLGPGVSYPSAGKLIWQERHPDTEAQIKGVCIPNWSLLRDNIVMIAEAFPYIPYVGWDVVMKEQDFKIIEGNSFTDTNLLQVHGPLLKDPRVRRFYADHGVILLQRLEDNP
jgi:hypothetical protein